MIGGFGKFMAASHARALAMSGPVKKGSIAPFDRIGVAESLGGERLSRPYAKSVWVQRAIKKVAGPIAAVSLQFMSANKQLMTDPDIAKFWKAPAVGLSLADFIEANVVWQNLAGETFWILDDTWLIERSKLPFPEAGRSKWNPLIVARPDRMRHVIRDGKLDGWQYTDRNGRKWPLLAEQVLHCKQYNPYDDWRGLSPMEAAMIAAESDYLAGTYARHVMRNNGDRGPYIVAKEGIPDEAQQKQLIEQLREKRELNQRGIFKPFFVSSNIGVEDPKAQAVDSAFLAQRLSDRHEIFLAFGVPPSMADKTESYSVGSASDWYMLIIDTCMPTGTKICGGIDEVTRRMTLGELTACFNWMEHPVMKAVRKESLESGVKVWATGMPWEKINEFLELGMPKFKGWEVGYLPFSVSPVGAPELEEPAIDITASPAYSEDADKTEEQVAAALKGNQELRQLLLKAPVDLALELSCSHGAGDICHARSPLTEAEKARWKELMAQRRAIVKAYQSKFNRELMKARGQMLTKLEGSKGGSATVTRAAAADFMFSLDDFTKGILAQFRKTGEIALQTAGEQLLKEIGKDDPFAVPPTEVIEALRKRENFIKGATQNVYDQVKAEVEVGLNEGDTMQQLADRVRSEFNGLSREHSLMIAQTETTAVYGEGREIAMKQAGVKFKKWLTSGNSNVRATHAEANGQVVAIDEAFEVGGEQLMHPGDSSLGASAGNVINCHCVSVPAAGEEEA